MPPRKNKVTKGERTKRTKVTRRPVSDAGESSRAYDQDCQPVSHRTRGRMNRLIIPDSDDELATEENTEDGSPVPSQSHIDSDSNDNVTVQPARLSLSHLENNIAVEPPGLSLSNPSDKVTTSGNGPTTHEDDLKILTRLCQELPDKLDEANYAPLSDMLANFESVIPKLKAHIAKLDEMQNPCTEALTRSQQLSWELDRVCRMMQLHTDGHIVKLKAIFAQIDVGRESLRVIRWNFLPAAIRG